ncbi:2'-5' RNA ligase family protein [Marivirga tractuosa]|nr:2'-5' RNA ligase family protein [Marivirga tractuosa]
MEKSMFFIGICPPHPLEKRIHGIKEEFRQKYGVKGGFRSKAHITLQMPFNLAINKEEQFISALNYMLAGKRTFKIELKDFGNFEPRVIFINVDENRELDSLQKSVEHLMKKFQVFNSTHKNNGFTPHITVAFRDLKKPTFSKIWNEVKDRDFKESFRANAITVFKHNGNSWDIFSKN